MGGDPLGAARQALLSNSRFADFMRQNQGKTPEQVAQENGIDLDAIKRIIG